jgi:hypothetical protein
LQTPARQFVGWAKTPDANASGDGTELVGTAQERLWPPYIVRELDAADALVNLIEQAGMD